MDQPEGQSRLVTSAAPAAFGWLSLDGDTVNHKSKASPLNGYWLPVKGEAADASRVSFAPDILGRMNYAMTYVHRSLLQPAERKARCALSNPGDLRACLLERLRGRTVYFIGDSHMRLFFYGFLTRLAVPYPPNKVWRGDRTDVIASHNVTVRFVASYFLNLSKPSALDMFADRGDTVVIAGVGQHHSCHCWTVEKHMGVVIDALSRLTDPASVAPGRKRHVLWFGIPAQPMNRHLHMAKPVGQARRDCRNNARHLLYTAYQRAAVEEARAKLLRQPLRQSAAPAASSDGSARGAVAIDMIDTLRLSVGMEHTSLDGAHYYSWAREAWIDAVERLVLRSGSGSSASMQDVPAS